MEDLKDKLNDEGIEVMLDEPEEPAEQEEQNEEQEDSAEEQLNDEPEEKTVPLTALQKEREKIRSLKKELAEHKKIISRVMEGSGARDPRELETRMDDITLQNYIEQQGMDENTARVFLMQQKKLAELERSKKDVEIKEELSKLKDNPFYADIDEVSDEVMEYAKDRNVSAKEAYNVLFAEQRYEQLARQNENRRMQEKKQEKKISALSSAGNAPAQKNTVKLTADEMAWAKAAGMTAAEYAKFKSMK